MRKCVLGFVFLTFLGFSGFAQNNTSVSMPLPANKVSGMVKDAENKPLVSITVCLLELPAKTSVILSRTNSSGMYYFENVPSGSYLIQTIQIGKQKKLSEPFKVESTGETILQPITMGLAKSGNRILDSLKSLSKSL